ncbi:hypothetical protein QBC47DRAFT_341563 [Echria macrotheca]|uniref:Uncharacterized protein n=1 Tax=Echria macrotheca TaxID=438768 RepID=A0AAJ0BGL1_9PEZI|nr:hypothetical protein QBC47DRAFT_341563 [Echria macrotheca]
MTLRDSRGVPTATITGNGGPMMTTITERDAHGVPTATITAEVSHGFRLVTLTDAEGRPTATITVEPPPSYWSPKSNSSLSGSGSSSDQSLHHPLKQSEYWLAYFLPVFLTTVVAICAQVISSDIRVMLPFHNLTRDNGRGVPASQSLLIPAGVINDYVTSFRMLVRLREPLPILGDLLVLLAALVTALSGEAVGIKLYGKCGEDYFNGCFLGIAVITGPAIALKVCLCLELVVLVVIWVLLTRWRTGVASVPHTIAATASLVQDPSVRGLFRKMEVDEDDRDGPGGYVREKWILDRLRNHVFGLGRFTHPLYNTEDYGVVVREKDEVLVGLKSQGSFRSIKTSLVRRTSSFKTALARTATACRSRAPGWLISQPTTNYVSLGGLIFFGGLLLLVLYYENTHGNDGFEDFMMDQNFGARFLFTVLGILISFFWGYYAAAIAILEPYRRLAVAPQPAAYSILISPSTAAVTDVASTILAGRSGWFVSLVQASVFLSNFTPVLLSGVPFSPAQTLLAHRLSAYSAVGCLAFMLLTLLAGAIWVRYPRMPLDPASLAGRIYYVCDSIMTHDFRGTSLLEKKAFRGRVGKTKRYRFGKMIGVSGAARTGVDYDDAHLIDGEKLDDVDL